MDSTVLKQRSAYTSTRRYMARNSSGECVQGEPLGQRQGARKARKSCGERVQSGPLGQKQGAR